MSDNRSKKANRISLTTNAINRQKRIAKDLGITHSHGQPHRYAKRHALDCGVTQCPHCGNPRKVWKQRTIQERRFLEDDGE